MTTFYVRADGDDNASGLSDAEAFKTLVKVRAKLANASITAANNDTVLFRRGDTFPGIIGTLPNYTGTGGTLTLGAYGVGKGKPKLDAYKYANVASGWTLHQTNVWKIDLTAAGATAGAYTGNTISINTNAGFLKVDGIIRGVKRWSVATLAAQWEFYSDATYTYVYSTANPTTLAQDIAIAVGSSCMTLGSNVTVAGLEFFGSGAHGLRGDGSADNVRIIGNYIHEIGGSMLSGTTRYGNGIEAWIGSENWVLEHNDISDVYDVAYTLQGPAWNTTSRWYNVHARRNRIWNCNQSFELWSETGGFTMAAGSGYVNCSFNDNVCLNAGHSWSAEVRPDKTSRVHLLHYNLQLAMDFEVQRNVFFAAKDSYFFRNTGDYKAPAGYRIDDNDIFLLPGQKIQNQTAFPHTVEQSAQWTAAQGIDKKSRFYVAPEGVVTADDALNYLSSIGGLNSAQHEILSRGLGDVRSRIETVAASVVENAAKIPQPIRTDIRQIAGTYYAQLGVVNVTNNYARYESMFALLPAGDSSRDKSWGFLKLQVQPQPPSTALFVNVDVFPLGGFAETGQTFRPSDFIAVIEASDNTTQVHTVSLWLNMRDDYQRMILTPLGSNAETVYAKFTAKDLSTFVTALPAGSQVLGSALANNPYAPKDSPAFTGTVTGVTKSMVGLSNVDNTADSAKPVSTAQAAALALKPDKNYGSRSPIFTSKLKGGNIAPKPGGYGWQGLFAEWDWTNWIKPQVDRAAAMGLNAIRLIGAPRCIFVDPVPGTLLKITQAQYDAHWAQLAEYCQSKGMWLYPCLVSKWDHVDVYGLGANFQDATLTASVKTTALALAAYPNVVAFDIFQEGDAGTGVAWTANTAVGLNEYRNLGGNSYKVTTAGTTAASGGPTGTGASIADGTAVWAYQGKALLPADVLALMSTIRNATGPTVNPVPLTMSRSLTDGFGWYDTTSMWYQVFTATNGADFVDVHLYLDNIQPGDVDFLAMKTGKPILIGEFGASQSVSTAAQTARYNAVAAIHNRRGVRGSFAWALADQKTSANPEDQWGLMDNSGFAQAWPAPSTASLYIITGRRTAMTDVLPKFNVTERIEAGYVSPNLLSPVQAKPRNNSTTQGTGWLSGANTYLYAEPRGLGFSATAIGTSFVAISMLNQWRVPVIPATYYRAKANLLAGATGRTVSFYVDWYDSAAAYISSSSAFAGTDDPIKPLLAEVVVRSHTNAAYAVLIAKVTDATQPANEAHIVLDAELVLAQ